MSIIFDHTLPADAASVPVVRRGVTDALERHGAASAQLRADVALALTEAVANAILHGYPDAVGGPVIVTVEQTVEGITVSVADRGVGASRRSVSPGLGLGLRLIEQLTTEWTIAGTPDVGTVVTMRFAERPPGV